MQNKAIPEFCVKGGVLGIFADRVTEICFGDNSDFSYQMQPLSSARRFHRLVILIITKTLREILAAIY